METQVEIGHIFTLFPQDGGISIKGNAGYVNTNCTVLLVNNGEILGFINSSGMVTDGAIYGYYGDDMVIVYGPIHRIWSFLIPLSTSNRVYAKKTTCSIKDKW